MRAGEYRHRIKIQVQAGSPPQDAGGAPQTAWTDLVAGCWAAVEPLRGRELLAAQQFSSEVTGQVRIRYRAGITAGMRVLWGTRVYDILAPIDAQERHVELTLLVKEGISDG